METGTSHKPPWLNLSLWFEICVDAKLLLKHMLPFEAMEGDAWSHRDAVVSGFKKGTNHITPLKTADSDVLNRAYR
jgi:hypothetical protein